MKKVLSIILTMLMVFSATPLASAFVIECEHPYGALDEICKECGEEDPLVELEVGVDYPTTCLTQNELEYAKFIPDVTALYAFKSSDYDDGWYGEDGDIIIGGGEGDDSIDWGEKTELTLRVFTISGKAIFEVRDNGKRPIDEEIQPGIGLSVCNTIIKAHGGELRAVNSKAGGLLMSFTLDLGGESDE